MQNSLDFHGPASGTATMDDTTREQLSFVFAKLTGTLEDATSLAVQGQNPRRHPAETNELILSIDALLAHADARVQILKTLLSQDDSSGS